MISYNEMLEEVRYLKTIIKTIPEDNITHLKENGCNYFPVVHNNIQLFKFGIRYEFEVLLTIDDADMFEDALFVLMTEHEYRHSYNMILSLMTGVFIDLYDGDKTVRFKLYKSYIEDNCDVC